MNEILDTGNPNLLPVFPFFDLPNGDNLKNIKTARQEHPKDEVPPPH